MDERIRMIKGEDEGKRDFNYMRRVEKDKGLKVKIKDVKEKYVKIGIWGKNESENIKKVVEKKKRIDKEKLKLEEIKKIRIEGKDVKDLRI